MKQVDDILDKMTRFPEVLSMANGDNSMWRVYDLPGGKAKSRFLFRFNNVIKLNEFHVEGRFPIHNHKEDEYAIVYEGGGTLYREDGTEEEFPFKEALYTPKGVKHWAEFPVLTKIVVVSIPPSKEYSDANNG